jgi:hypothetical protein
MNPILSHLLKAYRPMYLRGLLMDGQYRQPASGKPGGPADAVAGVDVLRRPDKRLQLAALTHTQLAFHRRNKS